MGIINSNTPERRRVGLIFDYRMCIHSSPDENDHPENPDRIRAIWNRLNDSGLVQRCLVLDAKKAEDNHLALVHSKEHIDLIKTISSKGSPTMSKTAAKFDSIYFNGSSSTAAYLAAGCVIEVAERVAKGELDSAFAVVRPPGHHAEQDKPMGFCLCNNIAIATFFLLNERPELGMSKILIVDWDIHHGNGTQKMFYEDPRVLVFSVHRHESGRFYPHGNDGSYDMIGEGQGSGYNINVPWENGGCGDADYIAVWDHILIPVAKEFNPDMIIISAGFDAAKGDPIGGCCVSSSGYAVMLGKLMGFARGKIVMALEGGYNPVSLADSTQSCIEVLLQEKPAISSLEDVPLKSTCCVIRAVRQALCRYWSALAAPLLDNLINRRLSQIEADAAIWDEVDFMEQANEKLSNKGDKGKKVDTETSPDDIPQTSARTGSSDALPDKEFDEYIKKLSKSAEFSSVWNLVSNATQKGRHRPSLKELKARTEKGLLQTFIALMLLCEKSLQLEEDVARLEAADRKNCSEISRLELEMGKLAKDRDVWKDRYEREVLTGKKFLESKSGQAYVATVKEETILDCRRLLRESGCFPNEDFTILHPEVPDLPTAMEGD